MATVKVKTNTIASIYSKANAIIGEKKPCALTFHYFMKQVVQIAEQVDNGFSDSEPLSDTVARIECAYDFAKIVADSGGLVYTTYNDAEGV